MSLACANITLAYDRKVVIEGLSLAIEPGKITTLLGPNGCGKSTLLRALAGLGKPASGQVTLAEKNMHEIARNHLARQVAFLPQHPDIPEGLTVKELISHGRFPYRRLFGGEQRSDIDAIEWALDATQLNALAYRPLNELSGGERQRAWIGMALAQKARILLLDEPTTYLDIGHQLEVLELLHGLNLQQDITIVMALHDLNQALNYSQHAVLLKEGKLIAKGKTSDVVTSARITDVFGVAASIAASEHGTKTFFFEPVGHKPHVSPA